MSIYIYLFCQEKKGGDFFIALINNHEEESIVKNIIQLLSFTEIKTLKALIFFCSLNTYFILPLIIFFFFELSIIYKNYFLGKLPLVLTYVKMSREHWISKNRDKCFQGFQLCFNPIKHLTWDRDINKHQ